MLGTVMLSNNNMVQSGVYQSSNSGQNNVGAVYTTSSSATTMLATATASNATNSIYNIMNGPENSAKMTSSVISNSTNAAVDQAPPLATAPPQPGGGGGQQINTISQMIAAKYQDTNNVYASDTDMSERTAGGRSNRSRGGHQQLNKQTGPQMTVSSSYDQQSLSSQSQSKMAEERPERTRSSKNNHHNHQHGSRSNSHNGNGIYNPRSQSGSRHNSNGGGGGGAEYSRQLSKRSVNFNEQQQQQAANKSTNNFAMDDNIEGSVMIDQNGQMHVRDTSQMMAHADQEEDAKSQQIQVQILPQDDNWGENTTAFTADLSDFNDDMTEDGRSSHFNGIRGHRDRDQRRGSSIMGKDELMMLEAGEGKRVGSCYHKITGLLNLYLTRYFGLLCAGGVCLWAFVTPILFMVLPWRLNRYDQWQVTAAECGVECECLIIGIACKLIILLLAAFFIFFRRPRALLPRMSKFRGMLVTLVGLVTGAFWLFYGVRIIDQHASGDYHKILQFTIAYVDVLLFVFIVSVFILKVRSIEPEYVVKMVRSPDGEQRQYTIGRMSIQRAAIWLLEQYYKDFGVYNPWLDSMHRKRASAAQLMDHKRGARGGGGNMSMVSGNFRDNKSIGKGVADDDDAVGGMDGGGSMSRKLNSSRMTNVTATGRAGGGNAYNANDRLYEEYEYERKLKKRRARLVTTTEEAFTHIRRMQADMMMDESNTNTSNTGGTGGASQTLMDPYEAAQAIFMSISRDLRRYLRITRQYPYFTRESIVAHLANCVSYDMSPKSFLQRYLSPEPLVFNEQALVSASTEQERKLSSVLPNGSGIGSHGVNYHLNLKTMDQSWILICDTVLHQGVGDNIMFVLKQNEVSLMCTFKRLPHFNLIEDILDPQRNKFVLKLNSETTV